MVLKRRISYQWRLFIPLVTLLWFIIGTLVYYQYNREIEYKKEIISRQLSSVNGRIIDAYQRNYDLKQFMAYVQQFYENTLYDNIMISVFDANGNVLYQIGLPIREVYDDNSPTPEVAEAVEHGEGHALRTSIVDPSQGMFYYARNTSRDGRIAVHTAMPFSTSITDALKTESYMWYIIMALAIITTAIAYFATRYISRNINLLRDFANKAASSRDIELDGEFPHDELGDISRQIVRIYRDKDRALSKSEHEHEVALRATEEKARIKRQLTNNINHELKTPVGVIKGYLDTIATTPDLPEELHNSFIEKARLNVERLCSLLNDISTITRLEESHDKIPTTEINYHDLVYDVSNDLDVSKINGDLAFSFKIPFECEVLGNYSLLSGMLFNLIRNAATYSRGSEIMLKMIDEDDQFYTFSFADNGIGVKNEHLPHLFERFYRADSGRMRQSAQSGGTGLGLPIVKNTIVTFGGHITVRNRPKGGLEFIYTLPKFNNRQTASEIKVIKPEME